MYKFQFFLLCCPGRNAISSKYLMNFQKLSFGWKMSKVAVVVENINGTEISIFPFTLSQQKCYIFKSIQWIFKNFLLAERWVRWLLWLKISIALMFRFCNNNVTTFPTSRKCINFNFSLYTAPAEMLYLQEYLTNFQKRFFGWKMRKVAIVVANFNCTDILVLQ